MVMEAQTNPAMKGIPSGQPVNGLNIKGLSISRPTINGIKDQANYSNKPGAGSNEPSNNPNPKGSKDTSHIPVRNSINLNNSSIYSSASAPSTAPPSPPISKQVVQSPRPLQSPVFFQTSPPAVGNSVPYYPSLSSPRSPISSGNIVSYAQAAPHHVYTSQAAPHHVYTSQAAPHHVYTSQAAPHHVYTSQAAPHHVYTSQHSMLGTHYCSSGQGRYPTNAIIINPAGATPGHGCGGGGGRITPAGCATPGRITPGRITPGRGTPVYAMTMKKKYVDIMLASTASTVAIDNKIEQAMDLVKSHLMFAVREEVDVLKERIGELMERINHLEYENTVLRKYATQEALQQIQQQHGGAPNP